MNKYLNIALILLFTISCNSKKSDNVSQEYGNIEDLIQEFKSSNLDLESAYSEYEVILDSLNQASDKNTLTESEVKELQTVLDNKLAVCYVNYCNKVLKSTDWYGKDIEKIENVSSKINLSLLTENNAAHCKQIQSILNDYHAALNLCNNSTFTSIGQTRSIVNQVKTYLSNIDLRYNQGLMSKLSALPKDIEKNQYDKIISEINNVDRSNPTDKNQYQAKIKQIEQEIKDYNDNAQELYGHNKYYPELMSAFRALETKYKYLTF